MTRGVFDGIKVVDFGWAGVVPWQCKYLADHGAEVVRIETTTRLDVTRTTQPYKDNVPGLDRAPYFTAFNNNKYGITLNLRHPKALAIAKRIVARADIVAEGYGLGTMEKWGLGYDELRKINPGIIMMSSSNLGRTGPYASRLGYGLQLPAYSGFSFITGWPDKEPVTPEMAYTDAIGPLFGLAALIAALDYRRKTGQGQYLDLSQHEAAMHFLAPLILDYNVNQRVANRDGNRCSFAAPHGAYPCQGEDNWCVIAVFTDEEWEAFGKVLGNPVWTRDPKFATLLNRKENEYKLDELVGEWTSQFTAEQVMAMMQESGVAAGVVETSPDLYEDPQLKHRQHYLELEHPVLGRHKYDTPPFKLSRTPAELHMPAPCIGQHNEYFYTKILGMSDQEFIELDTEGVFE